MKARQLIDYCQQQGLSLRVDGSNLKLRGTVEQLTEELQTDLKMNKPEILSQLLSAATTKAQAAELLSEWIRELPTNVDEVLASPLFDEGDLWQIGNARLGRDELRMYIGSWLIGSKQFPFVLHSDWARRLAEMT
jgi:hypothetical protein